MGRNFDILLFVGLMFALIPAFTTIGPILEGKFFPVAGGTEVTLIPALGKGTYISGTSNKLRHCVFVRLEATYDRPGGGPGVIVPMEILEGNKDRGEGAFTFGPWRVNLSEEQIRSGFQIHAYHRCYSFNPYWVTPTLFWTQP